MFMLHAEKRERATLKNWVWPGDEAKWTLQNVNFVHCAYKRIRSGSLDAGMPLINWLLSGSITTIVLEFGASKVLQTPTEKSISPWVGVYKPLGRSL